LAAIESVLCDQVHCFIALNGPFRIGKKAKAEARTD